MNNVPISGNVSPALNEQIQKMQAQPLAPAPQAVPMAQTPPAPVAAEPAQSEVKLETKPDTVELTTKPEKEPKKKKSFLEKVSNFVGSIKKLGVNIVEYAKGGAKGIGAFAVGAVAAAGSIFTVHQVKAGVKASKESGKNVVAEIFGKLVKGVKRNLDGNTLKKTLKSAKGIGTIAGAIAVGSAAFIGQIYKARLAANERKADLEHKYFKDPHNV